MGIQKPTRSAKTQARAGRAPTLGRRENVTIGNRARVSRDSNASPTPRDPGSAPKKMGMGPVGKKGPSDRKANVPGNRQLTSAPARSRTEQQGRKMRHQNQRRPGVQRAGRAA